MGHVLIVQDDYSSTKRCVKSGPQGTVLVHLFYFDIVVVHVDIHVAACVVWYDRQSIVKAIEGNPDRLSVANPIREDHNRQGIEQVALDRTVEGTGAVNRRVTRGTEEVLRIVIDLKSHLPLRQALLNLPQPDFHNIFHVAQREGALEGESGSATQRRSVFHQKKWTLTKIMISSIRLTNSGGKCPRIVPITSSLVWDFTGPSPISLR